MLRPIPKIVLLSAAIGLSACSGGSPDQADYNPPPKITADPEPFLPMQPVTFTASIHAPNYAVIGGDHPAILELRAIPRDKDGNVGSTSVSGQQPFVAPDGGGWSTVNFAPMQIPATDREGTLAVSVTYKKWNAATQSYIPVATKETPAVVFHYRCGSGTGEATSEPVRAAACTYQQ